MLKVLIVDDNFFMRAALRQQLTGLRCEVVGEATNSATALEQCRRLRLDLVTIDVVMDPDSGIQLAEKIRLEGFPVKILMVSAVGQPQIMDEARKAGADGYVLKPVEMDALKAALQNITGGTL